MKIASIDIGTNTVILLIAEISLQRNILPLFEKLETPRIGKLLLKGNNISGKNINKLFSVLNNYFEIVNNYSCKTVLVTGTSALRDASNSDQIKNDILKRYGWILEIIAPNREAEYSYLGVSENLENSQNQLVIDIGGGSTEISYGKGADIIYNQSFNVGGVNLTEKFFKHNPAESSSLNEATIYLDSVFNELLNLNLSPKLTYGISGTPVTLAAMNKDIYTFDEKIINGSILKKENIDDLVKILLNMSPAEITFRYKEIVKGREDIILGGAIILQKIMRLLKLRQITVSTKGLRYGVIRKYLLEK